MDINSLVSSYVEKTGADSAEVRAALRDIADSCHGCDSIFDFGNEATPEELKEYLTTITDRDDDAFLENIDLFFSIIDEDGNGELSSQELDLFKRAQGSQKGEVTGRAIFNKIIKDIGRNESSFTASGSSSTSGTTGSGSPDNTTAADSGVSTTGSDSDDTNVGNSSKNTNKGWSDEIQEYRDQIEKILKTSTAYSTPDEVIDRLLEDGTIDDEIADELRTSYFEYSDEDEGNIEAELMLLQMKDPDATRADAIKSLQDQGKLGQPEKSSSTPVSVVKPTLGDVATENTVNNIYDAMKGFFLFGWGTDEDKLDQVFNNKDLTPDDWVKIVNTYDSEKGCLVSDIDWDFNDGDPRQTKYYETIIDNLQEAAQNGNPEAITALVSSLKGSMSQTGTADEFINMLFDKLDDETLYKVIEEYGLSDLKSDLKNDHLGFLALPGLFGNYGEDTNNHLDKIDEVVNKYDRS